MSANVVWEKADFQRAKELFKAGKSVHDIAEQMPYTPGSICSKLKSSGLSASLLFSPQDDATLKHIFLNSDWNDSKKVWNVLLAAMPGRTQIQIQRRANRNKLHQKYYNVKNEKNPGMSNRFEYGLSQEEWDRPAKKLPKDPSTYLDPRVQALLAF